MDISAEDLKSLKSAVELLEFPTVTDRVTSLLGRPINKTVSRMPKKLQGRMSKSVHRVVTKTFDWVLHSVDTSKVGKKPSDWSHKLWASGTGFAGGFVGGWGVVLELPITTGLMLRTIADIARSEGEDLSDAASRLACVQVLALDTTHPAGAHVGAGVYYGLRNSLAAAVADASIYLATSHSGWSPSAPILVNLINRIAERYSLTVSEEVAAQIVPVIGGIGGAGVNYLFMDHFQRIAHGHFTVRRLDRKYGQNVVEHAYEAVLRDLYRAREQGRERGRKHRIKYISVPN